MADRSADVQSVVLSLNDLKEEALTDVGLSRLFARLYQDQLIFAGSRWFVWDGTRWREDDCGEAIRRATSMLDQLLEYVDVQPLDLGPLRKIVVSLNSKVRLENILTLASANELLRRRREDLDVNVSLLNFTNGTLDLSCMTLLAHDPRHLVTMRIEHPYDPHAIAPRWETFQLEVADGNVELIRFKQKMYGMAVLGTLPEQKAFFLLGDGANGKSVELEVVKRACGPYATTVAGDAFLKTNRRDPENTFARLPGVRLAIGSEIDERQPLAEGTIKSLTGGEELTARRKYENEFTFQPTATLFVATNHLPHVAGRDYAIRRRLVVVPFPVTFGPDRQDPRLKASLLEELPGILAWIVEGARLYAVEGLDAPDIVKQSTERFWTQGTGVEAFLESETRRVNDKSVSAEELYAAYRNYCLKHGNQTITPTAFGIRMAEAGFNEDAGRRKKDSATGRHVYVGIALNTSSSPDVTPLPN